MATRLKAHAERLETRQVLTALFPSEVSGISAPLVSAVIEPLGSIDLTRTDVNDVVWDPTELAQLSDPTTPTLVLDFNASSPLQFFDLSGGDVSVTQGGVQVQQVSSQYFPELTDQNNGELVIPLIEQTTDLTGWQPIPFSPGTYEINVVGGSGLATTLDGFVPAAFSDQQVAQFTVLGSGASFATIPSSNVLGSLGSNIETLSGQTLDPQDPSSSVQLYEFTLDAGHYWRLGAAVSAWNIGSPLAADLTLFDSQGDVIETRTSGSGLGSDPTDPYLFTGLQPGTYYLGISAAGNLPYSVLNPNGYNPNTGDPGSGGQSLSTGDLPFELSVVATPADQPTEVTSFELNSVALAGTGPTGFTVTFSGPINASELFTTDAQQTALEVVDSSGRVWPTTAIHYEVDGSQLTMIFDQPLAPGSYSLVVPNQGGLTDLAGLTVDGGSTSTNVLASWSIAPSATVDSRGGVDELGVLWPMAADVTWPSPHAGLSGTTQLQAGQSDSYQFGIIVPAIYELGILNQLGQVEATIRDSAGDVVYRSANTSAINDDYFHLSAGVYTLTFTSLNSQAAAFAWNLRPSRVDYESITANGVGQGNALSFWLTTSVAAASPGALGSGSSAGNLGTLAPGGEGGAGSNAGLNGVFFASGSESASSALIPASPIPSSLLVTLETNVVGLPTSSALNVAAVGPMVEAGLTAVADQSGGLPAGIRYSSTADSEAVAATPSEAPEVAGVLAKTTVSETVAVKKIGTGPRDPEAVSVSADRRALAQTEWLIKLASGLANQVGLNDSSSVDLMDRFRKPMGAKSPVVAEVALRGDASVVKQETEGTSGRLEAGVPVGFVVMAAVSYQMRRPLTRWWRARQDVPVAATPEERLPLGQGPHHRIFATRKSGKGMTPHVESAATVNRSRRVV
jgi:hypothetical protein